MDLERQKIHTRKIEVDGYRRADGLWDIEGRLLDTRGMDIVLRTGVRRAGTPLHEMRVRLTVDDHFTIVAAEAQTFASPYPGTCEKIAPDYSALVGLQIKNGFRKELVRLFGGLKGCTHITELLGAIATTAVQAISPELEKKLDERPKKLDGCHALDTTGEVVAYYYPTWYRKKD